MIKYIIFFISFTIFSFAQSINYGVLNNQAFTMKKGISFKASYLRVNDDLDFLNMRESELGSLSKYGTSIGDMSGYELEARVGIFDKDSLFLNFQEWNIDYGGSKLSNQKIEFFNRFNIVSNPYSVINSLSFDLGFIYNSADRVNISNIELMNSMINKISPNTDFSIGENGTILKNGTKTTIYDTNQNVVVPSVAIDSLSSTSYYLKLLIGKQILKKTILNLYSTFSYIDIQSEIDIPQELLDNISIANLNRDEYVLDIGFSIISEFRYLLFEMNYEYSKLFRDNNLNYRNYNHTLEITLSKPITKNFLMFLSGKMMFQQLNRDVPYLYNQYTESQFDKKYGFAKFGLIYKIKGF